MEWLQREYPDQDWQRQRRTVERRVRRWKAAQGPAKEVFFRQVHEPGRLGSSDFTHMDELRVTIQGQPFPHLLYHFVLTHSNWEHVTLCVSESFASLSDGWQNAVWELGAVPERHRTDRMTLAVHQDGNPERYTARYQALMRHYGVTAEATSLAAMLMTWVSPSSLRSTRPGASPVLCLMRRGLGCAAGFAGPRTSRKRWTVSASACGEIST